jgi:hypothetical protein
MVFHMSKTAAGWRDLADQLTPEQTAKLSEAEANSGLND